MLAEFSVTPIGAGVSVGKHVAECLRIIERSGLDYKINPMGTVVEGDFDEVMSLIAKCHKAVRKRCQRVSTIIKIDDRRGVRDAIHSKVASVEREVGHRLKT